MSLSHTLALGASVDFHSNRILLRAISEAKAKQSLVFLLTEGWSGSMPNMAIFAHSVISGDISKALLR